MGNCFGSPTKVGCPTLPPPPNYDRKEIYDNLTTILRESYDLVDGLQQNFAAKEMQNSTIIENVKKKVTQYSMMSLMSIEEAEESAKSKNKIQERYWFKRSKNIIKSVINRLKDVHVSSDQQGNLTQLVAKLQIDCLQWIKIAVLQLNNEINEAQSTDEIETERSTEDPYDEKTETFRLLFTCTLILQTECDNFSNICLYL